MGNLKTDNESLLVFEQDSEAPSKPLHEYVAILFAKIGVLWRNKRMVIYAASLGLLIAIGYSLLQPAQYVATAYILPPEMNPISGLDMLIGMKGGGEFAGAMSGELSDVLGQRTAGQTYMREMQSRPVQDNLIKRFDLSRVYGTKSAEATRATLLGLSAFDEDRKSGFISIQVTDVDPNRAAALANAYGEELGRLLTDISSGAGRRESAYFAAQLQSAQEKLDQASEALGNFSSKNSALDLPMQDAAVIGSIGAIQGRLIAAQAQLNGLLSIYTENNIRVKEARAQVVELQRQLDEVQGKSAAAGLSHSGGAGKAGSSTGSPSKMEQLAGLSTEYMDLYRESKADESMVEALTQQYEIAKLEESRHIPNLQVIDPARPPERKSFPKRRVMAMVGLFLGLLFGVGFVLTRDWWQSTSEENEWKKLLRSAAGEFHFSHWPWQRAKGAV